MKREAPEHVAIEIFLPYKQNVMGISSTQWKPGQKVEGAGRQFGSRNNRTKDIVLKLISLGHKDPLETLSELQNDSKDEGIRATAANMLAPYLHSKMTPVAASILLEDSITLPHAKPTTIQEALENIAHIVALKASGQLDRTWAESLVLDQRAILSGLVDEAKLLAGDLSPGDRIIRIEGGLPALPGTNVIMPDLSKGPMTELTGQSTLDAPLTAPVPVVPQTVLEKLESALLAWSQIPKPPAYRGPVEIDPETWDQMDSIPKDQLQALFDKYDVANPIADKEAAE
jgi:hypothetical protein